MNQLTYQLTPDYSEVKKKELWLGLELSIDGKSPLLAPNADDFDIRELLSSGNPVSKNPHFILTCSCGSPGCAGYFKGVKVNIADEKVEWLDQDQGFTYQFVKEVYFSTLRALYKELCDWNNHAKSRRLTLRLFPDWHLTDDIISDGAYLINVEC